MYTYSYTDILLVPREPDLYTVTTFLRVTSFLISHSIDSFY